MVNAARLRKELDFIRDNPDKWIQSAWFSRCGTYGCLAGNVVLHEGVGAGRSTPNGYRIGRVDYDGAEWSVLELAAHLLDLTSFQTDALFDSQNSFGDLVSFFESITGEKY